MNNPSLPIDSPARSSKITFRKKHPWYAGILITVLGIVLFSAAVFLIVKGYEAVERSDLEGYLKDKYSKEFKVEALRTNAVGIGMPGQLIGVAHPVDDDSLTFEVGKSRSTGIFFDDYSGAMWAQEDRPRVAAFLETIYGPKVPQFVLKMNIPTAAAPDPIRGKVPSIDEAIVRYGGNLTYGITMQLTTDHELAQSEMDDHTAKIKQIVDFVLAKKVSSPSVRYAINIENQNAGYLCDLYRDQLTDQDKFDGCLKKDNRRVW